MLTMMRNATKGWTAKILLTLLVASFAVWGVSGSMLQGTGNSVVTVGNTSVGLVEYRLAYDRQLNQLQRQLGSRLTREQAEGFGLSGNVLTQMVSGALLDETANEMGLGLSKDKLAGMIGDDEAFRDATGNFSRGQLQQVLRSVGMREEEYIQTRQNVAIRNQLIEGTSGKSELPDAFWKLVSAYEAEQRKFNFVTITDADIAEIKAPVAEVLKTYYEANLSKYVAPEFRKLNIVKLEAADIADEAAVSVEDVQAEYEAGKDSYSEPEKRTVEQLVFSDKAKAEEAAEKLKSGASFDDLLADAGKSVADVSLGTLAKSEIPDSAVADAAFALNLNEPSELVAGLFGSVILRVSEIQPGSTKPLSEVEGEIRKSIALRKAAEELFDTHDRLEDERAAGETLESAAKAVGLNTRVVEAVDRTARDADGNIINDIPQSQALLAEAFDTDEGVETDPISIGSSGFVWFEVVDIISERQKTLEEVSEEAKADWIELEKSTAVQSLAETMRERVGNGEDFNAVIADLLPTAEGSPPRIVQQSIPVGRNGEAAGLSPAAITTGFAEAKGSVAVAPTGDGNGRIVLQVADVQSGDASPIEAAAKTNLNRTLSDDFVSQIINRMQEDLDVEINQQAVSAALNPNAQLGY